ncbi:MAG: signal peptidase I [Oscillospiraceae bacterium]|nr:signal peptidase I [Oscillospiraceae bacterium]
MTEQDNQQVERPKAQPISMSDLRAPKETGRPAAAPRPSNSVWKELVMLGIKIAVILLVAVLALTLIYGFHRVNEPDMSPAIRDGDLVLFNRLDRTYDINDLVVLDFEGQRQIRRVVAQAGDVVDIIDGGLVVNGSSVQEWDIYYATHRFEEGVDFPLVVGEGQVFVLGDARENATDSRIYGPIYMRDTLGKVITVIRNRKF